MAENKTIQDKGLDVPCKHKNHTSLKHIGLKLACQDSSCKRPFSVNFQNIETCGANRFLCTQMKILK